MVFPFGVSVSDFIAGIKLFKDAIDALSDTRGARADFAELSRSLSSLENALKALGKVRLDTPQHMQALKQNLDACKLCLTTFLLDIAKFRNLDAQYVTKARLVMMFRQVQWALCKKDDVRKFQSEIEVHIAALEMLLITFQIESTMRVDSRTTRIEATTNGIATQLDSCAVEVRGQKNMLLEFQDKLKMGLSADEQRAMFNLLQETFQQTEGLRQEMKDLKILNNNLMHHVLDMKDCLRAQRSLPSQVLLQQPVVLHDALGRIAPFHLEFIDSLAAFLAVLKIRFEHVGRPKISRLEFDLRDTTRQSLIGLRKSLQGVFRPGQHVDMSMTFALSLDHTSCPGCHYEEERSFKEGESVQCPKCYITYRHWPTKGSDGINSQKVDEDISDLITREDGDCNVYDFSRVSIVKPTDNIAKVESKPQFTEYRKVHSTQRSDTWYCRQCGTLHVSWVELCPICMVGSIYD